MINETELLDKHLTPEQGKPQPTIEKDSPLLDWKCDDLAKLKRQQAWELSGCPTRHRLEPHGRPDQPDQWLRVYRRLVRKLGTGMCIALIGPRGTGKTQLGCDLIYEAAMEKGMSVKYAKTIQFFMELKASYRKNSQETEKEIILRFKKPDLLVIDELSCRGETDWEDRLFEHLLDERYGGARRDTLLIGNFDKIRDFDANVGPSIVSRIQETGGVIECTWPSFRLPK